MWTQPTFGALVRDVLLHPFRVALTRWRFWRLVRKGDAPFWYEDESGCHVAAAAYSMRTDQVTARWGHFGEVLSYTGMSRAEFLAFGVTRPTFTDHKLK
jgi:hypothetical protein